MPARHPLSTLYAPISEVAAYNKSRRQPSHESFNYSSRSLHHTINSSPCKKATAHFTKERKTSVEESLNILPTSSKHTTKFARSPLLRRIISNPKLFVAKYLTSFVIFICCWYTMHIAGALSTQKFPRLDQVDHAEPLPDLVKDYFGDPLENPICIYRSDETKFWPGADLALTTNFLLTLIETIFGPHGHLHLQRALHISALCFLCRTTVVSLTFMNNPNARCLEIQNIEMTYLEALSYVFSRFPHRACADLIFSGHTALLTIWALNMEWQNGFVRKHWYLRYFVWTFNTWGISFLAVCGSHYTVDVVLGFYFAYFLTQFYFVRCLDVFEGGTWFAGVVLRLEYWGEEWEAAGEVDGDDEKSELQVEEEEAGDEDEEGEHSVSVSAEGDGGGGWIQF